jgi:prevent-host-death family protein
MCYMARRATPSSQRKWQPAAARETPDADSRVGVRELRQNLSIYLERVKRGEVLTVTDHGHDVALLRPLPPSTDIVERMAAEGRVTRPTRPLTDLPSPLTIRAKKTASEMLIESRDEERH